MQILAQEVRGGAWDAAFLTGPPGDGRAAAHGPHPGSKARESKLHSSIGVCYEHGTITFSVTQPENTEEKLSLKKWHNIFCVHFGSLPEISFQENTFVLNPFLPGHKCGLKVVYLSLTAFTCLSCGLWATTRKHAHHKSWTRSRPGCPLSTSSKAPRT